MTVNHGVLGSSPCSGARGSLAQLVQSICLTSRGSAVRIRQLPQTKKRSLYFRASFYIFLSLYEPRGERNGKALNGADDVCAVANPSIEIGMPNLFLFYIRWREIGFPKKLFYINSDFYPLIEYCRNSFASSRSCPSVN